MTDWPIHGRKSCITCLPRAARQVRGRRNWSESFETAVSVFWWSKARGRCQALTHVQITTNRRFSTPIPLLFRYLRQFRQDAGASGGYEYMSWPLGAPSVPLTARQTRRPRAGSASSDAKPSSPTSQLLRRSPTSSGHAWAPRPCSRCCSTLWAASSSPTTATLSCARSRSHIPPQRA